MAHGSAGRDDAKFNAEIQAVYSRPFLALCGVVASLCGVVIGLWSSSVERELAGIHKILDERASVPPRTAELERRTDEQDKQLGDHEARIRVIERARR